MAEEQLKPCPFCGGEASKIETEKGWRIECGNNVSCNVEATVWLPEEDSTISAWNTRSEGLQPPVGGCEGKELGSVGSGLTPLVPSPSASGLIAQPSRSAEPEPLVVRAWRSHFPGMNAPLPLPVEQRLRRGMWDGSDFALSDTLALAGVSWSEPGPDDVADGYGGTVWLVGFCGIHEDPTETEWASLSPAQARALARALTKAAKLADASPEGVAIKPAADGEASKPKARATEPKSISPTDCQTSGGEA